MQNLSPLTYSIEQTMGVLNLSRATIYVEINEGRLRTYKVGRRRMVSHDALANWVKARESEMQGAVA